MQLVLNFLAYTIYAITAYYLGKLVCKLLFPNNSFNKFQNAFLNVLFGDIIIITCYSIIKSRLCTINMLVIVLFVILLITKRLLHKQETKPPINTEKSNWSYKSYIYLLVLLLPFLIRAVVFYNYQYHLPNIPHYDHQYYISIAESINQTGKENFFAARSVLFDQYKLATPYRYHDIWLTSLFLEFNLSSIAVYNLIVSSFTILISLLGLLSLFELYKKVSIPVIVLTTLFLFTGFAYFKLGSVFVDTQNPIEYQKLGISYALFSAAIIFYKKDMLANAIFAICLLFVFSAASLPLLLGIGLILLISFFAAKNSFKNAFILCLLPIVAVISFGVFYRLFGFKDLGVSFSLPGAKEFLFILKGLFIKSFARFWFLWIWLVVAIILNKQVLQLFKKENGLLLISLFLIVFCIIFQGVFVNLGDPNQFATNNTIPLLHIILYIIAVIISLSILQSGMLNKAILASLFLYLLASAYFTYEYKDSFYNQNRRITKYSKEYLQDVASVSNNMHNKLGVYWVDSSYYTNSNRMKEFFIRPGEYLKVIGNNYDLVCLAPELMPNSSDREVQAIKKQSALMIFKSMPGNNELNDTDLKMKFIEKYKIQYLILSKNMGLPAAIEKLIIKKIVDAKSGEVFCLLATS